MILRPRNPTTNPGFPDIAEANPVSKSRHFFRQRCRRIRYYPLRLVMFIVLASIEAESILFRPGLVQDGPPRA